MTYNILHRQTRKIEATARTMVEANRKVGAMNRAVGSTCLYGWVKAEPRVFIAGETNGQIMNSRGEMITIYRAR